MSLKCIFSVTAKGAVEPTKKREKLLGLGRNCHADHDPTLVPRPAAPFVFTGTPQPTTSLPPTDILMSDPSITSAPSAMSSSQPDTVAANIAVVSEPDLSQASQPAVSEAGPKPAVSLPGPGHQAAVSEA